MPSAKGGQSVVRALALRGCAVAGALMLALLGGCGEPPVPLARVASADLLQSADPARGRQLIAQYGCVACHAVPGVRGPASRVGPTLENMATRAYVAGVLPNTPENLLRWLRNPPAIDPLTVMPNVGLSEAEAQDITAYLLTLR